MSKSKIAAIVAVVLAAAGIGAYALVHQPKPSSSTVTPQASGPGGSSASAAPTKQGATSAPAAAGAPAQCATSDLALTLADTGGGTAGTTYRQAVLTNQSSRACTIGGFPGVSLVDADDQQLGNRPGAVGRQAQLSRSRPATRLPPAIRFPKSGQHSGRHLHRAIL